MELEKQRNVGQDQTSDSRIYGSSCFPRGQFRKISIGVTVDAFPQTRSGVRKGDGAKTVAPSKGKSIEESRQAGRELFSIERQVEVPNHGMNEWLATRSLHQETTTMKSVQFYANQKSVLQAGDAVCNKADGITYARERENGGSTEKVEEFAFASTQEMHVLDNGTEGEKPEKTSKGRGRKPKEIPMGSSEALKMKLWEILGTDPQHGELQVQQTGAEDLNLENKGQQIRKIFKPEQNSDTIETDSVSPHLAVSRPVTRSLARKNVPSKRQQKHEVNKGAHSPIATGTSLKQKGQQKNIFAFDEAEGAGTLHWAVSGSFSLDKRKNSVKKSTKIKPRRISFPRKTAPEKNLHAIEKKKIVSTSDKSSSWSNRTEGLHSPYQNDKDKLQPKNVFTQQELHHFPVKTKAELQKNFDSPPSSEDTCRQQCLDSPSLQKKTSPNENFESSTSPKNANLQEDFGSPSGNLHDDFQCPTFAANTSTENNITNKSLPQDTPLGDFQFLATSGKKLEVEEFNRLRVFQTPAPGSSGRDTHTSSSDGNRGFKASPTQGSSPVVEEKDTEKQSPTEEQGSESMEEFIGEGLRNREQWFLPTAYPDKPPYMLCHSKRLRIPDNTKLCESRPISPTSRGTEESNGSQGDSAQAQEIGLGRAIAQFAMVLERFKTKMNLQTSKKTAEILAAVADRIHLQLQTVESQIQTDVGKLTSQGKSKRKRLESRFQEQQVRLKLLHDKYKEEVNQHLKDCRSALEEVEAEQIELKGLAERQKASHMKLLSQVEEAIQIQLGDAQKSIEAINKAARKRMQGLQRALRDCLSEGVFS